MEIEMEIFEKVKEQAEREYKNFDTVYCPYLKKDVSFNAKGLDHIKFKDWNKTRTVGDQYMRLKFLKLAPTVIELSHTIQDLQEKRSFERRKINSRWERHAVDVKYYGFVAILKSVRIKVIVKEITGGKPYFWSIIPFWKQKDDPFSGKIKRVFHDGDLETQ